MTVCTVVKSKVKISQNFVAFSDYIKLYRRVGGYMKNEDWLDEAETLDSMISQKGFKVKPEYFYANGYQSKLKFWSRRNEVWKVKV